MFTQITKVLNKTFSGYSANTTYATDIPIRTHEESQEYGIEYLIKMCEYTDHIFYRSGTTFYFVDLLTGSTSVDVTDFEILENGLYSSTPDEIISKFSASWNSSTYNSQTYQLDSISGYEEVVTGLVTGINKQITPMSYINSEVNAVLDRKVTLYLRDNLTVKLGTVKGVQIGQVVNLVSDYATGSFVVKEKTLTKEGDEILSGIGTITY